MMDGCADGWDDTDGSVDSEGDSEGEEDSEGDSEGEKDSEGDRLGLVDGCFNSGGEDNLRFTSSHTRKSEG